MTTEAIPQPTQDNPCANVKPMKEWISEDTPQCRPCLLGVVTSWYRDVLEESGMLAKARQLEDRAETLDPLPLCEELDKIKEEVPEEVRVQLRNFDCAAQTYDFQEGGDTDG